MAPVRLAVFLVALAVALPAQLSADWNRGTTRDVIANFDRPEDAVQLVGPEGSLFVPERDDVVHRWVFEDEILTASPIWDSVVTPESYRDFRMHLEFNLNEVEEGTPRERNANSGVYIQERYELQILNSHGISREEMNNRDCACIYGRKQPDELVCLPAGEWQSFDIVFRAARFRGEEKTEKARVTVYHNGHLIHDDYVLPNKTGAGKKEGPEPMPIKLQGHHNPVRFRNIWIQRLNLDRPNVVLIMADDLGYRDLSCYGHPQIKTPCLDQLAADGLRLTSFYSGATVCTPSRMALLTGTWPVRLGWTQGVVGHKMGAEDGMHPDALTIAETLRDMGYRTAISGKWHLGNLPETRPHQQGFESSFYIDMSNNQTTRLWRDDDVITDPFENRTLTEQFTNEAIRFIREESDQPFFLYMPCSAPHFPVEPHPEWEGKSGFGAYGDVVEELDARVGELVDALKENGSYENTIVIFCSDNGPQQGEQARAFPFRGAKWSALEGGTRVPCIVSMNGTIRGGSETDAIISAIDLMPTLAHACGVEPGESSQQGPQIDGVNVWNTLLSDAAEHPRSELLYWHGLSDKPVAIRSGDWKLFFDRRDALTGNGTRRATDAQKEALKEMRGALDPENPNPPVLFNLADDPGETIDLSEEHADVVVGLQSRAEELINELNESEKLPIFGTESSDSTSEN
ncbi:MAG: sulfatase-like hydrolase/transferase [Planctomycetota bacterium]